MAEFFFFEGSDLKKKIDKLGIFGPFLVPTLFSISFLIINKVLADCARVFFLGDVTFCCLRFYFLISFRVKVPIYLNARSRRAEVIFITLMFL